MFVENGFIPTFDDIIKLKLLALGEDGENNNNNNNNNNINSKNNNMSDED